MALPMLGTPGTRWFRWKLYTFSKAPCEIHLQATKMWSIRLWQPLPSNLRTWWLNHLPSFRWLPLSFSPIFILQHGWCRWVLVVGHAHTCHGVGTTMPPHGDNNPHGWSMMHAEIASTTCYKLKNITVVQITLKTWGRACHSQMIKKSSTRYLPFAFLKSEKIWKKNAFFSPQISTHTSETSLSEAKKSTWAQRGQRLDQPQQLVIGFSTNVQAWSHFWETRKNHNQQEAKDTWSYVIQNEGSATSTPWDTTLIGPFLSSTEREGGRASQTDSWRKKSKKNRNSFLKVSPRFSSTIIYLQKQDLIQVQVMFRKSSSWENNHTFYHRKPITFEKTMIFWLPLWDMVVSKNRDAPKWMVYNGKPY